MGIIYRQPYIDNLCLEINFMGHVVCERDVPILSTSNVSLLLFHRDSKVKRAATLP